ncbi:MAG TPA: nicotinamide-nucleotide amidohydrolase family protein [Steroidobacteraceae bacterium]|nr:nicotinamide-nucleotide amidohydrolase family protein [Steroidobacteraceae bacterium]
MPTDAQLHRLAVRMGRQLLKRRRRLATAESCTGGWIAKAITDVAGSSQWFEAAYVTYSNATKTRTLGVSKRTLARHGAVSEPVVREMARGALGASGADIAVAVSGVAGPDGGTPEKPVGLVWLCWAQRRGRSVHLKTRRVQLPGNRAAVRSKTVALALQGVLRR